MSNLLSLMTFFPLVGMVVLLFLPRESDRLLKTVTLVITLITFLISLPLAFDDIFRTSAAMQYVEFFEWISIGDFFRMNYYVGIDGISLWLVLLTTFIMPVTVLSTALRYTQSGLFQNYALTMVLGMVVMVAIFILQ